MSAEQSESDHDNDSKQNENQGGKHRKEFSMTDIYLNYTNTYHEIPTFGQFQNFAKHKNIKIIYKEAKYIFDNPPPLDDNLLQLIREKRSTRKLHKSTDDSTNSSNNDAILKKLRSKGSINDDNQQTDPETQTETDNETENQNEITQNYTQNENENKNENTNETNMTDNTNNDTNTQNNNNETKLEESDNNTTIHNNTPSINEISKKKTKTKENKTNTNDILAFSEQIKKQQKKESMINDSENEKKINNINNNENDISLWDNGEHTRTFSEVSTISSISDTPSAPATPHFGLPPNVNGTSIPNGGVGGILNKFGGKLPPKPISKDSKPIQQVKQVNKNILKQSMTEQADILTANGNSNDNSNNSSIITNATVLVHDDDAFEFTKSETVSTWVDDQMD